MLGGQIVRFSLSLPSALFEAVEKQDLDRVQHLLSTCSLDLNCPNADDVTVLDVALCMNHVPMSNVLLANGARESPICE